MSDERYDGWMYHNLREKDTRWTPVNEQVLALIYQCWEEAGNNWEMLARIVGVRPRYLRRLRKGKAKVISLTVLDRIICKSSNAGVIHDLPWYTIEELVDRGIWEPPFKGRGKKVGSG